MRQFLILLFLQVHLMAAAVSVNTDVLLQTLDEAISHHEDYLAKRQREISSVRKLLEKETRPQRQLDLYYKLYILYRPYRNDSAAWYLEQYGKMAMKIGDRAKALQSRATSSLIWSSSGYYMEALEKLDGVNMDTLDPLTKGMFMHAWQNLYSEMAYYSKVASVREKWSRLASSYETQMLKLLPDNSDTYYKVRENQLLNAGKLQESLAINDKWMSTTHDGDHRFAIVAFYRYLEFKARRDTLQMITWLKRSALSDVKNGVLDQGSMWELANLLYYMGDTERAYRYIVYTAACTTSFGSKQRDSRMAALMADIVVRYRQQSERNNRQLSLALVGTSLLTVLLLVALLFIKRQRGKLHDALKGLAQRNLQMEDAYRNLKDANDKMSDMNTRLNELNNQLGVSNRIKEEYVAHFMALCRLYLDKLDKLRNQMRNLLKQHRFDQLERLANSSEIKNAEYEEFYQQFDEAFLKLFPDFVTDFNRLLRSDEHIEVKQPGHLTPALRIFALVRLGIDDSAQIAEFLNYSVNTIYNYRAQTRNKAAVNRDEFEKLVKQL